MDFNNLLFNIEDGVATIVFNRPKALNALNSETFNELTQVIDHVKKDETIKGLVLTGSEDKAFVAGADIA